MNYILYIYCFQQDACTSVYEKAVDSLNLDLDVLQLFSMFEFIFKPIKKDIRKLWQYVVFHGGPWS